MTEPESPAPARLLDRGVAAVKWTAKAYLMVIFVMFAVLFVVGFLAAPFDSLTGGNVR